MLRRPTLAQVMIQEKSEMKEEKTHQTQLQALNISQSNLTATNQTVQYFSFRIQNPPIPEQPTIAWQYNIPQLNPNQRNLYLATQSFSTTIIDYVGDNFPQTISIALRGFSGFIDRSGSVTPKIIILNLSTINSSVNAQGIVSRDIVYKNDTCAMWQLGSLRNLIFQLYLDEQTSPIQLPITNSIALAFKILHLNV